MSFSLRLKSSVRKIGFEGLILLVAACALAASRDIELLIAAVFLCLMEPVVKPRLPKNWPRWITGVSAALFSLILNYPLQDRLTLMVFLSLTSHFRNLTARILIMSAGCMVLAGNIPNVSYYKMFSSIYGSLLFFKLWMMESSHFSVSESTRSGIRMASIVILFLMTVFYARLSMNLLPEAQRRAIGINSEEESSAISGFGDATNLNGVSSLKVSHEIVMRAFVHKEMKLRGAVYTRYSRGKWMHNSDPDYKLTQGLNDSLNESIYSFAEENFKESDSRHIVELLIPGNGYKDRMFLPKGANQVYSPGSLIKKDRDSTYISYRDPLQSYSFSMNVVTSEKEVKPDNEYLQITPDIAIELKKLIDKWSTGIDDDALLCRTIADKLRTEYEYSLDNLGSGTIVPDPVVTFLFERKSGHCEFFATAMTLLLRTAGIHSRYVTGYEVNEKSLNGSYFIARNADAHAWVEAFDGEKWVVYDPTPADWQNAGKYSLTAFIMGLYEAGRYKLSSIWRVFIKKLEVLIGPHAGIFLNRPWLLMITVFIMYYLFRILIKNIKVLFNLLLKVPENKIKEKSLKNFSSVVKSLLINVKEIAGRIFNKQESDDVSDLNIKRKRAIARLRELEKSVCLEGIERSDRETLLEFLKHIQKSNMPEIFKKEAEIIIHEICYAIYGE